MKNYLRYPRNTSELNRMINFLDRSLLEINEIKNKKNQSREWMRVYHAINTIRKDAIQNLQDSKKKHAESKTSLSLISMATSNIDFNFHDKVINILEKWMKINRFPKW